MASTARRPSRPAVSVSRARPARSPTAWAAARTRPGSPMAPVSRSSTARRSPGMTVPASRRVPRASCSTATRPAVSPSRRWATAPATPGSRAMSSRSTRATARCVAMGLAPPRRPARAVPRTAASAWAPAVSRRPMVHPAAARLLVRRWSARWIRTAATTSGTVCVPHVRRGAWVSTTPTARRCSRVAARTARRVRRGWSPTASECASTRPRLVMAPAMLSSSARSWPGMAATARRSAPRARSRAAT